MRDDIEENELFMRIMKYIVTLLIVISGIMAISSAISVKSEERIKLAKIAAATSQYCDCLKLIEVE